MKEKDAKIFVASVKNVSKSLELYGDVPKIETVHLLKLIYKYANYCITYRQLQRLNSMVSTLQNTKLICSEFQANRGADYPNVFAVVDTSGEDSPNQPPVISDSIFALTEFNDVYTFSNSQIYNGFADPEGDLPGGFVIKSLPSIGTLLYDGNAIVLGTLYSDPTLLTYERFETDAYVDLFAWTAFDNNDQLPLESNIATMTGTIQERAVENQPPTIGDRAQYSGNRVTTVFTLADFTTQTIAPYFDPEGNNLDAIRIDELSDANTGVYYYFNNPVIVGQVITAEELGNGAFYHVAPDSNGISTDSFNASVRDDVSMIWVQ